MTLSRLTRAIRRGDRRGIDDRPLQPRLFGRREPDERALDVITLPGGEDRRRFLVLHPFRYRLEAEPACQIDEGVHEGAVVFGSAQVLDEGAVDLDHVDAEPA